MLNPKAMSPTDHAARPPASRYHSTGFVGRCCRTPMITATAEAVPMKS
jgi:hypothetical protein